MLHSDIACAPAPGARLRAFRPEYQGKCRTRQFPLDNSRILRIQSVYTVIATPPDTSRNSRKVAGQCNGIARCTHQRKHTYSPLSTRRNHPVPTPQASQGRVPFAGFTACHFSIIPHWQCAFSTWPTFLRPLCYSTHISLPDGLISP